MNFIRGVGGEGRGGGTFLWSFAFCLVPWMLRFGYFRRFVLVTLGVSFWSFKEKEGVMPDLQSFGDRFRCEYWELSAHEATQEDTDSKLPWLYTSSEI
jgi:hypothetical protein